MTEFIVKCEQLGNERRAELSVLVITGEIMQESVC